MLLKQTRNSLQTYFKLYKSFSQPQKKRTQAPKYIKPSSGNKLDPNKVDYSVVPQQLRKGVKAYVQASNMMVASEAQLQAISLKQIIIEERQKFQKTLDQIDAKPQKSIPKNNDEQVEQEEKNYDFMSALRFSSAVSNALMVSNIAGYVLLNGLKKYEYLGFFLGVSMSPAIITLTGLSIGFNAASWIIIQSLHLSIKDPNELTLDKISLTGCSPIMYLEALSIAAQTYGLSYYLMSSNPVQAIKYLAGSFVLAQTHSIYNIIKATNGYRFQFFSKLLITQIVASLLVGSFAYSLFNKIDQCKNIQEYGQIMTQSQISTLDQNFLLKKGYERFLSEFKAQHYEVIKDQTINKLLLDEVK